MSGYGRTVRVHASVRITSGHENWSTSADHSSAPAIYASETEAVQPPDDRTYSAEVTAFRRTLLHHRIGVCAVSPHNLRYDTMCILFCQAFFQSFLQNFLSFFGQTGEKHVCVFGRRQRVAITFPNGEGGPLAVDEGR